MKFFKSKIWAYIERFAVILGIITGIMAVCAFIFPGKAAQSLDWARIQLVNLNMTTNTINKTTKETNDNVKSIKKNTELIVSSIPKGIEVGELFANHQCSPTTSQYDRTTLIIYNNEEDLFSKAYVNLFDKSKNQIGRINLGNLAPKRDSYNVVKGRLLPDFLCVKAKDSNKNDISIPFEVVSWETKQDLCEGSNDTYSSTISTAAVNSIKDNDNSWCY